jgi:hypothetical protein
LHSSRLLPAVLAGLITATASHAVVKKTARPAPAIKTVARETVYVAAVTRPEPKPEPREEPKPLPIRPEARSRPSNDGPLPLNRDGVLAYGFAGGVYAAEVLGATAIGQVTCEWYPLAAPLFFQFTGGGGLVQSDFSQKRLTAGALSFENDWLVAFEALGGYAFDLSGHAGSAVARGLYPYFLGGMTALWQGGVPNFGGVVGFGHRFPVPFVTHNDKWALSLNVKEHVYSQKLSNTPSLTQNFVVTWGLQKYF